MICSDGDKETNGRDGFVGLYGKIRKVVEALAKERKESITVMIDDVSLMEVAANGRTSLVLDFLHYCRALTSELVRHTDSVSTHHRFPFFFFHFFRGFSFIVFLIFFTGLLSGHSSSRRRISELGEAGASSANGV